MPSSQHKPLQGVRILAIEQYGAGPFCSMNLADLGAEVIKIESPPASGRPGGDSARHTGPFFLGDNDSHFFQAFNRNKRSISLDIYHPEGYAILLRLVAGADALVNNLRGDQPEKLKINYPALKDTNPRLVCAHISGYGRHGPRAGWPAYDYLAQAESGYMHLTGEPDTPPTRMGLPVVDLLTGLTTAFSMTAALLSAARTGQGCDVDVTLYDVAMQQLTYPATWYLNEGHIIERRPRSGHPSIVPCEVFPTADGQLFIMCITPKFWHNLCVAIGKPELAEDSRFSDFESRFEQRDALVAILDDCLQQQSTTYWMQRLAGKVPVAPVLSLNQALDNPYYHETGGVIAQKQPERPDFKVVASPIRINGERPGATRGPGLGADTDSILAELDIAVDSVARLREQGVIG